jgi:hypothetical protein
MNVGLGRGVGRTNDGLASGALLTAAADGAAIGVGSALTVSVAAGVRPAGVGTHAARTRQAPINPRIPMIATLTAGLVSE